MVKGIRIYVEGGAPGKEARTKFREGFSTFFTELVDEARDKKLKWHIIPSGSRNEAYKDFVKALATHLDSFNVLLVDSEGPVNPSDRPIRHLQQQDNWNLSMCDDDNCHLMVQMMEAWFIADPDALAQFYGQDFNEIAIPKNPQVETIPKADVAKALTSATKKGAKGPYQKGRHAPKLLIAIDPNKVRASAPFCDNLFSTIHKRIKDST